MPQLRLGTSVDMVDTEDMVDMAMEATVMAKGPLRLMLSLAT